MPRKLSRQGSLVKDSPTQNRPKLSLQLWDSGSTSQQLNSMHIPSRQPTALQDILQGSCRALEEISSQIFKILTLDAAAEVFAIVQLLHNEGGLCVCTQNLLCAPCLCTEEGVGTTPSDVFKGHTADGADMHECCSKQAACKSHCTNGSTDLRSSCDRELGDYTVGVHTMHCQDACLQRHA